jgi:hypothetical protein
MIPSQSRSFACNRVPKRELGNQKIWHQDTLADRLTAWFPTGAASETETPLESFEVLLSKDSAGDGRMPVPGAKN